MIESFLKRTFLAAVTAISVTVISGCESELRTVDGAGLEPVRADGTMRWKTFADAIYPADSKKAEAKRLRQLDKVLELNAACPSGYKTVDCQTIVKSKGALGDIVDVFYTVRCT